MLKANSSLQNDVWSLVHTQTNTRHAKASASLGYEEEMEHRMSQHCPADKCLASPSSTVALDSEGEGLRWKFGVLDESRERRGR